MQTDWADYAIESAKFKVNRNARWVSWIRFAEVNMINIDR
jgi:hypothetical protein